MQTLLTRPSNADSHALSHVLVVLPPEPNFCGWAAGLVAERLRSESGSCAMLLLGHAVHVHPLG
jgi:hypothetical protein